MNKGWTYHQYGAPAEVLHLEDLPIKPLGPGEVRVRLWAAPVHPSDGGMIQGRYGRLMPLPAIGGREAAGEIVEVGPVVKHFKVGTPVACLPEQTGTWQQYIVAAAQDCFALPETIDLDDAAMLSINPPTAWCLLHHFVDLKPGDWIIQNGAASCVGQCVIQLAHLKGIRTINVVRSLHIQAYLKALGADRVVEEGSEDHAIIKQMTQGRPIRLAFNSVGGPSAIALMRTLADSGTLVTFGGASVQPVRFPTRALIFNDIRCVGFWWDRYRRCLSVEAKEALYQELCDLIVHQQLKLAIEKSYPLQQAIDAIGHASQGGRQGKILITAHSL